MSNLVQDNRRTETTWREEGTPRPIWRQHFSRRRKEWTIFEDPDHIIAKRLSPRIAAVPVDDVDGRLGQCLGRGNSPVQRRAALRLLQQIPGVEERAMQGSMNLSTEDSMTFSTSAKVHIRRHVRPRDPTT
jgi:hypothetical protein